MEGFLRALFACLIAGFAVFAAVSARRPPTSRI